MEYVESLNRVCSYFNLTLDDLLKPDTSNKVSLARNFAYYILHFDLHLSINQISRILGRGARNIKRRIANIKYSIEHSKEYNKMYNDLLPYIYDL